MLVLRALSAFLEQNGRSSRSDKKSFKREDLKFMPGQSNRCSEQEGKWRFIFHQMCESLVDYKIPSITISLSLVLRSLH